MDGDKNRLRCGKVKVDGKVPDMGSADRASGILNITVQFHPLLCGGTPMSDEVVLYRTEDGRAQVQLRAEEGTVWLSQAAIAELFDTTKQNVSLHARNILEEGELGQEAVVKESLTTAADGKKYKVKFYNLPMILAIGYRVRSPRGTQFRQWATGHLAEYLTKGFVMDDERLKNPGGWDYFDELLARIREIRASEKRFYQKVRDLFALSLAYWREQVDRLLAFNDRPVLTHVGSVSHEAMRAIAHERFEQFDEKRRKTEALAADAEDIQALESIALQAKGKGRVSTK